MNIKRLHNKEVPTLAILKYNFLNKKGNVIDLTKVTIVRAYITVSGKEYDLSKLIQYQYARNTISIFFDSELYKPKNRKHAIKVNIDYAYKNSTKVHHYQEFIKVVGFQSTTKYQVEKRNKRKGVK